MAHIGRMPTAGLARLMTVTPLVQTVRGVSRERSVTDVGVGLCETDRVALLEETVEGLRATVAEMRELVDLIVVQLNGENGELGLVQQVQLLDRKADDTAEAHWDLVDALSTPASADEEEQSYGRLLRLLPPAG